MTLLLTVLRGLRSRALLSAGSVLLTALAIGSAVLGPIFQVAVTNSFLVSRLDSVANPLTGLSWSFAPDDGLEGDTTGAEAAAVAATADVAGPFAAPQTLLWSNPVDALAGQGRLLAKDGACDHLDIEGRCPTEADEVLLLKGDADDTGLAAGDTFVMDGFGPGAVTMTVVGTYAVPATGEDDYWFDLDRFVSIPPDSEPNRPPLPYRPAPFVTPAATFSTLSASDWTVLVDRRLDVPADLTLADVDAAEAAAAPLTVDDPAPSQVAGGTLVPDSFNDIDAVAEEARVQQGTARNSIGPAVISLVLVALALLLRLLMAAADLRLPELALASLRGLSRRKMWWLGLSEPVTLLVLSVPVGGALGVAMALGLVRWWLVPGLPLPTPWAAALTGIAVVVATLGVAVLAVGLVLRVSLSEQLTGVRRPRRSSRVALVAQLALVAAAIAVLASKLSAGRPGDPDVTDLVLPVLLAVVAGLAATRLTAGAATWWTRRRPRGRSLPGFVAARAISRRQEGTLVILPVTAAIAICVFGAGIYSSAAEWRTSVAATAAPAPVMWRSPLPLDRTVDLTRRLDPDGKWLMAASTMSTQGPTYVVVDTPRLSRVAAWQDQWTPGVSTQEITDDITLQAQVPTVTGKEIGLTVDNQATTDSDLYVRLRLDAPGGRVRFVYLGPFPAGESTQTVPAPYCSSGCGLSGLTLGGPAALQLRISGDVTISDVTADGAPVDGAIDGAGWSRAPDASAGKLLTGVETDGTSLVVSTSSGDTPIIAQLASGAIPSALPVVRGVDAPLTAQSGASSGTSATSFDVDPVITSGSVPLLGPAGLMIDYAMLTADRTIYVQDDVPVYVLARADTPASVRQGLTDRGITVDTTLAEVQKTLGQSAYALALRLYAVVALLVLLMAMAGLFVSTAVQLPSRRRDAASLRVLGVPRRSVMSAVLREFAFVLGGTAVAGLAAGSLAQYVVLRTVTLGYVENLTTPALVASIDPGRLVLLALVTAVLFGTVAVVSAVLTVRGARGATLRENAR